jgi:hypothetical protein
MSNLSVKKLNPATTIITGSAGTGKTVLMKKMLQEQCANGTQCIVFSLFGEYKQKCEALGGTYISVTDNFPFNNFQLPENRFVVYNFKEYSEDKVKQPFKDLLRKVYDVIKYDTVIPKHVLLDISQPIYDYTYDVWSYMADNLREYNVALTVTRQE